MFSLPKKMFVECWNHGLAEMPSVHFGKEGAAIPRSHGVFLMLTDIHDQKSGAVSSFLESWLVTS